MGHNVGDQANRAVKKSEKKAAEALRTPVERLAAIRGSVAAKLYVTPDDIRFLLDRYDEVHELMKQHIRILKLATDAQEEVDNLQALNASQSTMITELREQVEQFRTVYEQENRSTTLRVERVVPIDVVEELPPDVLEAVALDHFHDDGGPVFEVA